LHISGFEQGFFQIFQSFLEVLSFTAKYAPEKYDYDQILTEMITLPMTPPAVYSGLFTIFKKHLLDNQRRSLVDVLLTGITNHQVTIGNANYRYMARDIFKNNITDVLAGQQICEFSTLMEINRCIEIGLKAKPPVPGEVGDHIENAFKNLPFPGISEDAPKALRMRVEPYSRSDLNKMVKQLVKDILLLKSQDVLWASVNKIYGEYLIYHLRDHLLGLCYAVNAKEPQLKPFLNPNFARLHDLGGNFGDTLWDNFSRKKKPSALAKYFLNGPISRLNIAFSNRWREHLFRENIIYNFLQIESMLVNVMEYYPMPKMDKGIKYHGLLVKLGLDILRECQDNESLRKDSLEVVQTVACGYHYRRIVEYLNKESESNNLFFSEFFALGKAFWQQMDDKPYAGGLDALQELKGFMKSQKVTESQLDIDLFGACFPNTFGNMVPQNLGLFPQDLAGLFAEGWLSGGIIDEYKYKMAYHFSLKDTPSSLFGQILFMYLNSTAKTFLRQNHNNDYSIAYFIFDIFNTSHLNMLIKKLQKEGHLQLL